MKFKNPWRDTRSEAEQEPPSGAIGGDPSQGYYNTTPPAGGEPPLSPSGHSLYTDAEFEAWDAAGRPSNHDYLKSPGLGRPSGGMSGWGRQ